MFSHQSAQCVQMCRGHFLLPQTFAADCSEKLGHSIVYMHVCVRPLDMILAQLAVSRYLIEYSKLFSCFYAVRYI